MARKKAAATSANGSAALSGPSRDASESPASTSKGTTTTTEALAPAADRSGAHRMDILAASKAMDREVIKVNNMNMTELKNACDDAVKKLLSQPDLFMENHTHTDVKLAMGWASVLIAGATALYGWKVEFEQSKPLVWTGVILYVLLTSLSTLYSFFIEKNTVYVGKRKMLSKRIETERLTISSHTHFPPTAKGLTHQPPKYSLTLQYIRSSNSGKSLLAKGNVSDVRGYNEFFDEAGTMEQERFDKWVASLVQKAMEGEK